MGITDDGELVTSGYRDLELSLRRTLTPMLVGVLVAKAARAGFDIPAEALSGVLEGIFAGLYYAVVRVLEQRAPWVGVFLGAMTQPLYPSVDDTMDKDENDDDR